MQYVTGVGAVLVIAILVALFVLAIGGVGMMGAGMMGGGMMGGAMLGAPAPLDILKTRYARGEISQEQFQEMRSHLGV